MEDYEKESNIQFVCAIVVIALILLFRYLSFDNTVLKYVNMEPFSEPIQETIENGKVFQHKTAQGDAYITPIAKYQISGRVLVRHYRPSKLQWAAVYPYDVTIGFGDFKQEEVYRNMSFKMASTVSYYSWSASAWRNHLSKYFKNEGGIHHCWTNNHICPANKNVLKGIKKLQKKDIVYMEGYLVKFKHYRKDGRTEEGISSTSRNDKESWSGDNGSGSCEQIYVTRVVSRHGDFR